MTWASDNGAVRFLTMEQVAEELNLGVPSIRALLKTGELRGIQVGGRECGASGGKTSRITLTRRTEGRLTRSLMEA